MMMKITLHAAQKFLERVMGENEFTQNDLFKTCQYLELMFKDVIPALSTKNAQIIGTHYNK